MKWNLVFLTAATPLLAFDFELIQFDPSFLEMTETVRLGLSRSNLDQEIAEVDNFTLAGTSSLIGLELGINAFHTVLDPWQKTSYYPEVLYPVRAVYKKMGDRFETGDPLIQIEDSVALGKYHEAFTLVQKGEAELAATKDLFDSDLASLFELKKAEADLATAYSSLATAKNNLEATKILAPYSGVVDTVSIQEYELPQNGKELIKILQDDRLIAKLLIPSQLLSKISIGTPFYIAIENSNEIVQARISRIGSMIDPSSSTIKIEAEISNKEFKYKPGMSGIAAFERFNPESFQ